MTKPDILVYSFKWHLTQSDAFADLVIDPLSAYAHVTQEAWSSRSPVDQVAAPVVIFCQVLPDRAWIARQKAKIIYIPMWDMVSQWRQKRWNALPKSLHIVAFSNPVEIFARNAGLPTLRLHYYKNPAQFPAARWNERVLLYWNRKGLLNPQFMRQLCETLRVDRLLFRPQIDHWTSQAAAYELPSKLGSTVVERLARTETREQYWEQLQQANIFVAPRRREGVGMSFIEAMASGCAVLAHDAPTMNEYISHGQDGFLFKPIPQRLPDVLRQYALELSARMHHQPALSQPISLSRNQNWDELGATDLQKLGQTARERHSVGFERWQSQIEEYARFVLER